MSDISAFPTLYKILYSSGPTAPFIAGETITAGQLVGFGATGTTTETVYAMDATSGEYAIGVACNSATTGEPVTVALPGAIAEVVNADDTTEIDQGDWLEQNDNAVKGTVSAINLTAAGATVTNHWTIGRALVDITGGSHNKALLCMGEITVGNSA